METDQIGYRQTETTWLIEIKFRIIDYMDEMNKRKHGRYRFNGAALEIREIYAHVSFRTLPNFIWLLHSHRPQTRRLNRAANTVAQTTR
jgi:hypothetical protein